MINEQTVAMATEVYSPSHMCTNKILSTHSMYNYNQCVFKSNLLGQKNC